MLPKRKRLTAQEVAKVLSRGRSVNSSRSPAVLSMKFLAVSGPLKVAVVVAKSLARKATLRNSLRRAVYQALSTTALPGAGFHAIFFVRSVPKEAKTTTFREEIEVLLKKL